MDSLDQVRAAFEGKTLVLPFTDILPLHQLTDTQRASAKFRRIAASIKECGVIEPPVVARTSDRAGKFLLLDGHTRIAVLTEMGETEARCLISSDDEAYTFNKRVARLATIQEHFMIVRAIERGVSEEKLARALNIDIQGVVRKRNLLDGICPEVVDLLRDKSVNPIAFAVMRKMKPPRQIEAAELMVSAGNYSGSYAKALLAATRQHDLLNPEKPKEVKGLTSDQMARMEREMEILNRDFKMVEQSYGDDLLNLVVASGYLSKLISNSDICRYLETKHPEFLTEFKVIIAAASLDESAHEVAVTGS